MKSQQFKVKLNIHFAQNLKLESTEVFLNVSELKNLKTIRNFINIKLISTVHKNLQRTTLNNNLNLKY